MGYNEGMAGKSTEPLGLYTLDEAAAQLGISRRSVNRLVEDGALKVARFGHRTVRVRPSALDELLKTLEQRKPGTSAKRRDGSSPRSAALRTRPDQRLGKAVPR
jgi:excisionase family DNA binding protein